MFPFIMQLSLGPNIHDVQNNESPSDLSPAGIDISILPENIRQQWVTITKKYPELNQRAYFHLVQDSREDAADFLEGLALLASASRPIVTPHHASLLKRSGKHAKSFSSGLIAISETFGQAPIESVPPALSQALAESLIFAQEHARSLGEALASGFRCCHTNLIQAFGVEELSRILLEQEEHLRSFNSALIYLHMSGLKVRHEHAQALASISPLTAEFGLCWLHLSQLNPKLINHPNFELLIRHSEHIASIDAVFQNFAFNRDLFTPQNFCAIVQSGPYAPHMARGLSKLSQIRLTNQVYHCLAHAQEYASTMAEIIQLLHKNNILSRRTLTFLSQHNKEHLTLLNHAAIPLHYQKPTNFTEEAFVALSNAGEFARVVSDTLIDLPSELITISHCNTILAAKEHARAVGFCLQLLNEQFFLSNLTPDDQKFFKNDAYRYLVEAREHATSFIAGLKALMVDGLILKKPEFFQFLIDADHKACEIGQLLAHLHLYAPGVFESHSSQFLNHPKPNKLALAIFSLWCEKKQPLNQLEIQDLLNQFSEITEVPRTLILSSPSEDMPTDTSRKVSSEIFLPSENNPMKNSH